MARAATVLVLVASVLLPTTCGGIQPTPTPTPTPSASSAIAKVSPAVVRVLAEKSMGSGMILEVGYVLTNNHAVGKTKAAQVILADGRKSAAPVFGIDETRDLAILKISADNLPSVVLGKSSEQAIGDEVIAVGFPLGSDLSAGSTGESVAGKQLPRDQAWENQGFCLAAAV